MSNLTYQARRSSLRSRLRKEQLQTLFTHFRTEILKFYKQQQFHCQNLLTLIIALQQIEKEGADLLNLYVNIEELLENIMKNENSTVYQNNLTLQLYIRLTAQREIMEFLAEKRSESQFGKLLYLIEHYQFFREEFYERMKVLLELSYQYLRSHFMFSLQTTAQLLNLEPQQSFDSMYFQFFQLYISLMPKPNLYHLIESDFAQKSLQCSNNAILLSILGRLQVEGETDEHCHTLYEEWLYKKNEIENKVDQCELIEILKERQEMIN